MSERTVQISLRLDPVEADKVDALVASVADLAVRLNALNSRLDQARSEATDNFTELAQRLDGMASGDGSGSSAQIDRIEALLTNNQGAVMADLTAISSAVQADTDATNSAVTLLTQLADQVRQNASDPAAIQQLADQISSQASTLAQAVTANTPAATPPADTPPADGGGTTPPADVPPADGGTPPGA